MTAPVIGRSLVVSAGVDDLNDDSPIIGYQTLVTADNVTATTEEAAAPASNLANNITALFWRALDVGDVYLTVDLENEDGVPVEVDYLAIAAHNFGSGVMAVSVEGNAGDGLSSPDDDWSVLADETFVTTDGPIIFRCDLTSLRQIRLRIRQSQAATRVAAQCGVMYVGQLLYVQRRIYVGHTPMPFGREIQVANNMSITGAFLGRIVLASTRRTNVEVGNLTPDWYRTKFEPFVIAAQEAPFFFAWRPGSYPEEGGFAWLTDNVKVENQRSNGMMQVSMSLEGVA